MNTYQKYLQKMDFVSCLILRDYLRLKFEIASGLYLESRQSKGLPPYVLEFAGIDIIFAKLAFVFLVVMHDMTQCAIASQVDP